MPGFLSTRRLLPVLIIAFATFLPARVRADVVIPSDFTVSQAYYLNRCEEYRFLNADNSQSLVSACVSGRVDFGLNTMTGFYGAAYDFWTTYAGTPPAGAWVQARMCEFGFDGHTSSGSASYAIVGGYFLGSCSSLTSGIAYSPIWESSSRLITTEAAFIDEEAYPQPFGGERYGSMFITVVPEPPTLALLEAGLLLLVGATRAQHRRTRVVRG